MHTLPGPVPVVPAAAPPVSPTAQAPASVPAPKPTQPVASAAPAGFTSRRDPSLRAHAGSLRAHKAAQAEERDR